MFTKQIAVLIGFGSLVACSDTTVAPPAERAAAPYQLPAAAHSQVAAFAQPPVIPNGPRFEIYSDGVLKRVFSASSMGALAAAKAPAELSLPPNFNELLDAFARQPVNKRTAHFVEVMRALANAPVSARGKAIEAMSRQLLRETEHKSTKLADGTRILEYYFDHQLAGRVVLPPRAAAGQRRSADFGSDIEAPGARETVSDPDATVCTTCEDEAYDAMLWADVVWIADQLEAMVGEAEVESDLYITYEKLCLAQMAAWAAAVAATGYEIASLVEGWGSLTRLAKEKGVMGAGLGLSGAIAAWIAMHQCFHT